MSKLGWQTFATNNNFRYRSDIPLLREAYVVGTFGLYQVRLETFSRHTQIFNCFARGVRVFFKNYSYSDGITSKKVHAFDFI